METDEFGFALCVDSSDDESTEIVGETFEPLNIYDAEHGSARLYQLIRSGNQRRIVELIDAYGDDFAKIRKHLEWKYRWDKDDKIWLEKTILVASGEEQCWKAKGLENDQISSDDLRRAVFVLLKHPVKGEDVAILHPDECTRLLVFQLIIQLIPNGFLSWKSIATGGRNETFMEVAAACGLHEIIDKLYELGDVIAVREQNSVVRTCELDTIKWLLTKHFDNFDCALRDVSQQNALIVALRRNDAKMFDLLMGNMIAYRKRHYNESESKAFNKIFRYESECSDASFFTFLWRSEPMYECVEKAITQYKLDIRDVTNIENLISCDLAIDYCFEGIRSNPELLGLVTSKSTTILHELIRNGHTDFLREMYQKSSTVQRFFHGDAGFDTLRTVLIEENREAVKFILEHHREYLESDPRNLKENVVSCQNFSKQYFDKRFELLAEFFSGFLEEIEQLGNDKAEQHYSTDTLIPFEVSSDRRHSSIEISNDIPLLHQAVQKDDQVMYLELLEAGHDIDTVDNAGNHSIHFVQSKSMLDLIVNRHPEGSKIVNRTNHEGFSLLHNVCSLRMDHKTKIALLERIIGCGANVNQLTSNGESIVFFVEDRTVLNNLVKRNVQLDVVNADGETALERHLCNENIHVARALLILLHKLPKFKEHAYKYLDLMLKKNRYFFKQNYQDVLEKTPELTKTIFDALYQHSREAATIQFAKACRYGINFIVEKFSEFNYDINYNYIYVEDDHDENCTPLFRLLYSCDEPNDHLIELLIQKGADLKFRNVLGRDAFLEFAYRHRYVAGDKNGEKMVQLMLERGASIDSVDLDGNTALHWAFLSGRLVLIGVLIRNGANFRMKNEAGMIPLQMASAVDQELFYFWS